MLACNEEILKKQRSLSRKTPVLDLFKSTAGIRLSAPALLDIGDDDPNNKLSYKDNECDEDVFPNAISLQMRVTMTSQSVPAFHYTCRVTSYKLCHL